MAQETIKFGIAVSISSGHNVSPEKIAKILGRLLDAGLEDAQQVIEDGEGDLYSAELATSLNISSPIILPQNNQPESKNEAVARATATIIDLIDDLEAGRFYPEDFEPEMEALLRLVSSHLAGPEKTAGASVKNEMDPCGKDEESDESPRRKSPRLSR